MSRIVKDEQPGVETTVSTTVETQIYVIVRSKEYEKLCEEVNEDHVSVFTPPKNGTNILRRPGDGEMMIDLRDENSEEEWVEAP